LAIIKSPVLFSQYFKVDPKVLENENIFDPILNIDTLLFIDPLLLEKSEHKIINKQSSPQLKKFFENIISLLGKSTKKGDFAYRAAFDLLPIKEVDGTCLGYGTNSTSGRGISKLNREKIIETASEIVKIGILDPDLFIILPLFYKGIGADTISDITTSAIKKSLLEFTAQYAKKFKIKTITYSIDGEDVEIIKNPQLKNISPILLLPNDILRKLPFASTWDEIVDADYKNKELRTKFNKYIGMVFKAKTKKEKHRQLASLMKNKNGINTLLEIIKASKISPYDFKSDKECIMFIRHVSEIVTKNKLDLSSINNDMSDLKNIVIAIIKHFKFLIEEKGMNSLLWKDKKNPNKEEVAQKVFHIVADSYCRANNIDLNPEMHTGIGNVDFKFSQGFSKKIIVEIKLSTSHNIINGFTTQLQLYKKSEETLSGYYIIIDVGYIGDKYKKLKELYVADQNKLSEIFYIDALHKLTASKRKPLKSSKKSFTKIATENDEIFESLSNFELPDINFKLQEIPDFEIPEIK
jgi:hypothetical protein